MTSFGPLRESVLLLTFVTNDKSKSPHGSSGNETENKDKTSRLYKVTIQTKKVADRKSAT